MAEAEGWDKSDQDQSTEDLLEQIQKLQKEKEKIEKQRERKQLEQTLKSLRENVSSLKTVASPAKSKAKRDADNASERSRNSEGSRAEAHTSLEESQALLQSLRQSVQDKTSGASTSYLNDSREDSSADNDDDDVMSAEHKQALRVNRDILVENMTPDDIFNDLISKHILSNSDVSRIKEKNTVEAINEELLNVLVRRSDKAFDVFVSSLKRTLQGWLAKRLDPGSHSKNKRKRRTGEINVDVDCQRVVPASKKRYTCTCQEVEEQILIMAKGAFSNIRRRDATPAAFEQFRKELKETNAVIKDSMEIMNTLKVLCRHGDLTNLSEGSIRLTIRCKSMAACQQLWEDYKCGQVLQICQDGLVTRSLLKICGTKSVTLRVRMSKLEYLTCALELGHKEARVLKRKQLRWTPMKFRLRERHNLGTGSCICLESGNREQSIKGSCAHRKRWAFQEIPNNQMSSYSTGNFTAHISAGDLLTTPTSYDRLVPDQMLDVKNLMNSQSTSKLCHTSNYASYNLSDTLSLMEGCSDNSAMEKAPPSSYTCTYTHDHMDQCEKCLRSCLLQHKYHDRWDSSVPKPRHSQINVYHNASSQKDLTVTDENTVLLSYGKHRTTQTSKYRKELNTGYNLRFRPIRH